MWYQVLKWLGYLVRFLEQQFLQHEKAAPRLKGLGHLKPPKQY